MGMTCILCGAPTNKAGVFIPNDKTKLIVGLPPEGLSRQIVFGICDAHLDSDGQMDEETTEKAIQAVLRRVREPGLPEIITEKDFPAEE